MKHKENFIGYIRLHELERGGVLEISCAVSPEYRNQKYGQRILEVLSNYLLENYKEIEKLKGVIDKSNYESKKMASSVGFSLENQDDFYS